MRDFSQGRLRQQVSFLRRQFLQEGRVAVYRCALEEDDRSGIG